MHQNKNRAVLSGAVAVATIAGGVCASLAVSIRHSHAHHDPSVAPPPSTEKQADLEARVSALEKEVAAAKAESAKSRETTAPASYGPTALGSDPARKFTLAGFIQARAVFGPKSGALFPEGSPAKTSPYNGNYAQGGSLPSFTIRRARLDLRGALTPQTRYALFLEGAGTVDGSSLTTGQNTIIRQAAITHTFGNGDSSRYPSLSAGLIANPFGALLNELPAIAVTPERPLIANETGAGLFPSQDWDRGVRLDYGQGKVAGTVALVNGSGFASNATHHRLDRVYRVTARDTHSLTAGVSYYDGELTGSGVGIEYQRRRRRLVGADIRYMPAFGSFLIAEYAGGTFEQISAFGLGAATTTNPMGYATVAAPGNRVSGYAIQAGHRTKLAGKTLTPFIAWDVLRRSASGRPDSGSSWDDRTLGAGVSYDLDRSTRLRLWTSKPQHVAYSPSPGQTTAGPRKNVQVASAELITRF